MFTEKKEYDIDDLLEIMTLLRSEKGCPWDIEQNHQSIRMNVLEEAYEVMEAIDANDMKLLKEELGDLLLQVVFHAEMEREKNNFDFNGVCDVICKKLIYRHPHVFKNTLVDNSEEVLKNWDKLKSKSKGESTVTDRLESVPKVLPALMKAEKVVKRASNAGFYFGNVSQQIDSLKKQTEELSSALSLNNDVEIECKLGELLFNFCVLCGFLKKDAEKLLTFSINKFIMHFRAFEKLSSEKYDSIENIPAEELNELWLRAINL